MCDQSQVRPIFIIGCPRSGTTLLRLMLDSHPNISCGPETGFLIDMERILGHHWSHLELYGFDRDYWRRKIAEFFASYHLEYTHGQRKRRWAEKTPHYTPHLPFILSLFPSSQIVHMIRDGRDVVASHRNRWGYKEALRSAKRWRQFVTVGCEFGKHAAADQYHEVRYENLVNDPETTLRSLLAFLEEPWDDQVLHHLQAPHDIQPTYALFTEKRRSQGKEQSPIYDSRIGAWRRELDPFLKLIFYLWSGPLLRELGYV